MDVLLVTIAAFAPMCVGFAEEARTDDEAAVHRWVADLGSGSSAVRQRAARSLRRAGERAIPALGKAVGDERPEVRLRASRVVQEIVEGLDEAALERTRRRLVELDEAELLRTVERQAAELRQRRSLAALKEFDAEVVMALPAGIALDPADLRDRERIQSLATTVVGFHLHRVKDYDAALPHLQSFPELQRLKLSTPRLTDAELKHLEPLSSLHSIELYNTRVTDEGLRHLAGLKDLRELHLGYSDITDEGLAHLRELNRLESLNLLGTRIGDEGLAHLVRLGSLRWLDLSDTRITDAGLQHLAKLAALESLDVSGTKVTVAGVAGLQAAIPGCRIKR